MNNLVVCRLYLLVFRTAPQIDSIQLSFIISFNKVSLPTDHHNLLTHWLGSHSEQYSMGVR